MSLLESAGGVINAALPLPWLVVGGQPTEAQFRTLQQGGIRTVIDVRDTMEPRSFDEPTAACSAGLHYVNAPVVSGALTDVMMERVLLPLRAAAGTPTLLHCNSANRTGGPLIAFLMLDQGMDEADAVDIAMRSGLRSAELLEWATDYARRKA